MRYNLLLAAIVAAALSIFSGCEAAGAGDAPPQITPEADAETPSTLDPAVEADAETPSTLDTAVEPIDDPKDLTGTSCEHVASLFATWKREDSASDAKVVVNMTPLEVGTCQVEITGQPSLLRGVFIGETVPLERIEEDGVTGVVDL